MIQNVVTVELLITIRAQNSSDSQITSNSDIVTRIVSLTTGCHTDCTTGLTTGCIV